MQNKNPAVPLIIIAVILLALLVVSVVGWTRAQSELRDVKNTGGQLSGEKNVLAVCDDTSTLDKQTACVERLSDLSKLLSSYEAKIKGSM